MCRIPDNPELHHVPHQLNVYLLDVDSCCTSYGKHNRLVVMADLGGRWITIREDDIGLPESTEADRQRVAKNPCHRLHPARSRLVHLSSERYQGWLGPCIEHEYRATPGSRR